MSMQFQEQIPGSIGAPAIRSLVSITRKIITLLSNEVNEGLRLRPYHVEYTSSRPITEVKQRRARLVLGWVTAWEYRVS